MEHDTKSAPKDSHLKSLVESYAMAIEEAVRAECSDSGYVSTDDLAARRAERDDAEQALYSYMKWEG